MSTSGSVPVSAGAYGDFAEVTGIPNDPFTQFGFSRCGRNPENHRLMHGKALDDEPAVLNATESQPIEGGTGL